MASALLAGVSPIYGFYGNIVGPVLGGTFSSSRRMVINSTNAAALAAGQALTDMLAEARLDAFFLLVIVAGAFQLLIGLLGFGQLTRFVSYSVMTGFHIGISVILILSQLGTAAGYSPSGDNSAEEAISLFANIGQFNWLSVSLAALTTFLVIWLPRTRVGNFGTLVAIVVPSIIVAIFSLTDVEIVDRRHRHDSDRHPNSSRAGPIRVQPKRAHRGARCRRDCAGPRRRCEPKRPESRRLPEQQLA